MKKFNVNVHYEGGWLFEIEAENEKEAKEKAEKMFDDIPDSELIANLADVFIDGCWEANEAKFSIREAQSGLYLTEENNGKYEFGKEEDRIIFYDEAEAESVVEHLNDVTELCCVLLDENK